MRPQCISTNYLVCVYSIRYFRFLSASVMASCESARTRLVCLSVSQPGAPDSTHINMVDKHKKPLWPSSYVQPVLWTACGTSLYSLEFLYADHISASESVFRIHTHTSCMCIVYEQRMNHFQNFHSLLHIVNGDKNEADKNHKKYGSHSNPYTV